METEEKKIKGFGKRENGKHSEQIRRKAVKRQAKRAERRAEKEMLKSFMMNTYVVE